MLQQGDDVVPQPLGGLPRPGLLGRRAGTRPDHLDVADQLAREPAGEHVGRRGQLEVGERVVGDGDRGEAVVGGGDGLDLVGEPLGLLGVADAVQLVHARDDPPAVGNQHLGGGGARVAEAVAAPAGERAQLVRGEAVSGAAR